MALRGRGRPLGGGPSAATRCTAVVLAVASSLALSGGSARTATATLSFTVAATTQLKLTDVVWTGTRFLLVDNTTNRVFAADRSGRITGLLATMPNVVEETRCVVSPSRYGFPRGGVFCHSPDNRIYRIAPDGTTSVFATLPDDLLSDGALAVDGVGRFGHRLVAATGHSGGDGGSVFTIDERGAVRRIGSYPGPGGAENAVVAPATFGSQAGSLLLTLDKDSSAGAVVAIDARGAAATIARLSDGANPIAVVPPRVRRTGVPRAGFYMVDTFPGTVLFAGAEQFAGHAGHVIVGSEVHGLVWLVAPTARGFSVTRVTTNLDAASYNLEGATFIP